MQGLTAGTKPTACEPYCLCCRGGGECAASAAVFTKLTLGEVSGGQLARTRPQAASGSLWLQQ